jgi:hypothetical protein
MFYDIRVPENLPVSHSRIFIEAIVENRIDMDVGVISWIKKLIHAPT